MTTTKFLRLYFLALIVLAMLTAGFVGATLTSVFVRLTPADAATCNEDETCWDWATMGNLTRCDLFTDDSALYVCQRQGEGGLSGWTVWTEQR